MAMVCPVCGAAVEPTAAACSQCGFNFSGSTQAFKPVSVQPTPNMARPELLQEATLSIVKGPQVGNVFRLSVAEPDHWPQPAMRYFPQRHDGFAHACNAEARGGGVSHRRCRFVQRIMG